MTVRRVTLLPLLCLLSACVATDDGVGPQLGVQVYHLTGSGPEAGLPATADTLRIMLISDGEVFPEFSRSVVSLEDLDGDGSNDREIAVEVPPDRPVSIAIHAKQATTVLATARVDGLVVSNGARRYVGMTFTEIGRFTKLPETLSSGRFAHAAALIAEEGRVLVTGGFTVGAQTTCPAALASAEACFSLQATNEAFIVDTSDFSVYPTQSPMLQARALHTATALGDGRVLIAGGVSTAVLGLMRVDGVDSNFELRPQIEPTTGFEATARTFEIFDPTLNAEEVDEGRDGDPQAGGFIGAPGQSGLAGQMNAPRYAHAATLLPGSTDEVMLVGGQGSAETAVSGEIFSLDRAGGSGFLYPPTLFADTSLPREWPAAATSSTHVYVLGGALDQATDSELLERWSAGEPPTPGGSFSNLPNCTGWDMQPRPRNAISAASAVIFGRPTQRILVAGWLGPLCTDSGLVESYDGTYACSPSTYASRSFTVGLTECTIGQIQSQGSAAGHLFGPAAAMPNGQALIIGGLTDGQLNVTRQVELLSGQFTSGSNLAEHTGDDVPLEEARAWHTATTLHGGRVLVVGGMNFNFSGTDLIPSGITANPTLEIYDPGWDPSTANSSGE